MVDMSLRILHVSQPTDAGVAVCVAQDIADQTARGWHVVLACPPDSWLSRGALGEGVDVRPWKASRSPGPGMLGETIRLRRVLRATRPHLLHLHSSKAMLAGRLAARGRVETVVQPHAWSFEAVAPPWNTWATAWERAAARWTSAILCVSEAERQRGEGAGIVGRYVTTPNGVDLVAFPLPGPDDRAAARRRLGSPAAADAPLAVCVGRLSAQKGQDVLVECWPRVRSTLPEAQLVLVGDGPARSDLAQRASTGVHLVGASGDVRSWLTAADVVVCPSRYEGMALVPLEAMACGRSVVASDIPANAETLPPEAGALVSCDDLPALAAAIAARLADVARADAEGRVGRAHVEAHHDVRSTTAAIAALYCEILAGGSTGAPAGSPMA